MDLASRMDSAPTRTSWRSLIIAAVILAALAGGLRFFRLGSWIFVPVEIIGFDEVKSLFDPSRSVSTSQVDRLPRMIPLGHLIMAAGQSVFGRDEFGSRAIMALIGTADVLLLLFGLRRPLGFAAAVAAAALVALWPEHIYFSQLSRFYAPAAFFATLCMVSGAHAIQRRSTGLLSLAIASAFAALFCHTIQGVLLGCLLAGVVAAARGRRDALPRYSVLIGLLALGLALGLLIFYLMPLGRGWNRQFAGEAWARSPIHNVLALVYWLGLPTAMLAPVGALAMLRRRPEQGPYWLIFAAAAVGISALLPLVAVFHPDYAFPLGIGVMVLSGYGIGTIFELLNRVDWFTPRAWFMSACGLNVASLTSYYADGNRHDIRPAARYIESHLKPGDRLSGHGTFPLLYYSPTCKKIHVAPPPGRPSISEVLPWVRGLTREGGRIWLVFQVGRLGLPADLQQWLWRHCRQELRTTGKHRYVDRMYAIEVYLWSPEIEVQGAKPDDSSR
jgi:hypothetical protein